MLCDNSSTGAHRIISPQCYSSAATKEVTVYYTKYGKDAEHDTLSLCDECAHAMVKDAHRHGYSTHIQKL